MKKSVIPPSRVPHWSTGLAVIVFCLTVVAAVVGWFPLAQNGNDLPVELDRTVSSADSTGRAECTNCGVISATCILDRPDEEGFMAGLVNATGVLGPGFVAVVSGEDPAAAERKDGRYHQATVRFPNGTVRMFTDRSEPRLQVGERVRVTDGVILRIVDAELRRQQQAS
ncbi:MAG: hypothetical protein K2Q19_05690 [Rhodocyclaceae bacterium]|nr:hypothetical protein [Rhodocyclaceae bacterium]